MTDKPYQVGERRPIAARNLAIFQRLAARLARCRVSPNTISLVAMFSGIAAGFALLATAYTASWQQRLAWAAAAALVQLRLLGNMLDGMVAVESGRASPVGELFNEVPDRVSDAATLIGAGYAAGGDAVLGYIAACVALFTAYVRAMGKAGGGPNDFRGPMAKQQRMAVVTLVALYGALAPHDWQPACGPDAASGLMAAGLIVIILGGLWTAIRRLNNVAAYLRRGGP